MFVVDAVHKYPYALIAGTKGRKTRRVCEVFNNQRKLHDQLA